MRYPWRVTLGMLRIQDEGDKHFVTVSCYERKPYFNKSEHCELFEDALERMRERYQFEIFAYVIMPEHVHLLVSEPKVGLLSDAMKAIKLSVTQRSMWTRFWMPRYYDFNVYSGPKYKEKVKYIHRNPVTRGLVYEPEEWKWSSYRHYLTGEIGRVEIASEWARR
ncbi:REP-associated tyrosine transposase [Terriglobus albidus]|uniref:REP-associated tyrosine transposase n=1 Tax=Terriglobus albidus TaxID=1592106 RepID=UPI001FE290A2|nr:transposase [Terriglobus albidus]